MLSLKDNSIRLTLVYATPYAARRFFDALPPSALPGTSLIGETLTVNIERDRRTTLRILSLVSRVHNALSKDVETWRTIRG